MAHVEVIFSSTCQGRYHLVVPRLDGHGINMAAPRPVEQTSCHRQSQQRSGMTTYNACIRSVSSHWSSGGPSIGQGLSVSRPLQRSSGGGYPIELTCQYKTGVSDRQSSTYETAFHDISYPSSALRWVNNQSVSILAAFIASSSLSSLEIASSSWARLIVRRLSHNARTLGM